MSDQFNTIPSDAVIATTAKALEANGFAVTIAADLDDAKAKALALIPEGAEVLTSTSATLDATGIAAAINESGKYNAVYPRFVAMMSDPARRGEMRKLGAAPDYVIGSVHAVTQTGEVLVASATGSQFAPYAFGAGHVVWVVGAQKIVTDLTQAGKRLRAHTFPLENARALKVYGGPSSINKEVVFHREMPGRIDIVLIKEVVGF